MVDKKKAGIIKKAGVKKASTKKASSKKKSVSSTKKSTVKAATKNKTAAHSVKKKPTVMTKTSTKKERVVVKKTTTKKVATKALKKVDNGKNDGMVVGLVSKSSDLATIKKERNVRKVAKKSQDDNAPQGVGSLRPSSFEENIGEDYMNDTQIAHFERVLVAWRKKLLEEVGSTVVHLREDVEALADPLDRASQEEGFRLELRTRDRERKLIKKIEKSLDDIKNGDYGFCKDCGIEIGLNRLGARPTAVRCIDCKTIQEIKEKQGAA